jgi:hypothetical protein
LFAIASFTKSDRRCSTQGISFHVGRPDASLDLLRSLPHQSFRDWHDSPAFNSTTHCLVWADFSAES